MNAFTAEPQATSSVIQSRDQHSRGAARLVADFSVLAFGVLMTLTVSGYQFGLGNHTVYLLDALCSTDPTVLRKDWFVRSTLQYHAIFTWMTAVLIRMGIVQSAFAALYVLLAVLWQLAWLRIVQRCGGSRLTYMLSVVMYYLLAGGIALGVYQFLQDGCFLPSNVANVAMLWGFYFWSTRRPALAGAALGLAGLFHLNHAVVGLICWAALGAWEVLSQRPARRQTASWIVGSVLLAAPSLFNVSMALAPRLRQAGVIPAEQFIAVYVRFRHLHHFDPFGWPGALWVAFLLPFPLAVWGFLWADRIRRDAQTRDVRHELGRIALLLSGLLLVALVFAGIWYVSESLVQLTFWRFSIYVKLLTCIGAAYLICDARLIGRRGLAVALGAISPALAVLLISISRAPGA
ncbi:MAG: hypothetical protein ACREJC_10520, partial [Tepidisphaeraceae bacterium]